MPIIAENVGNYQELYKRKLKIVIIPPAKNIPSYNCLSFLLVFFPHA